MATINVSLPSDGSTADVADYNTPITTIVNEINGALDNSNLAAAAGIAGSKLADGGVTNAKLASGTGEPAGAWNSWTPTLSGRFDDAKWTKNCKYKQVGKTVFFRMQLTASTTTPMSGGTTDARFTLPVTAVDYAPAEMYMSIGSGGLLDAGGPGIDSAAPIIHTASPTTIACIRFGTKDQTDITSTTPWTWTTSDQIFVTGMYEAA